MKSSPKHPGVYIPPPVIGILVYLLSYGLQWLWPLPPKGWSITVAAYMGGLFIGLALFFGLSGVKRFWQTGNTVETFKAANSLQTTGIYSKTRNPMYVGLVCFYAGLTLIIGSWWAVILTFPYIIILQEYVIKREENYLKHAFGEEYLAYLVTVRRWWGKK